MLVVKSVVVLGAGMVVSLAHVMVDSMVFQLVDVMVDCVLIVEYRVGSVNDVCVE